MIAAQIKSAPWAPNLENLIKKYTDEIIRKYSVNSKYSFVLIFLYKKNIKPQNKI